MTKITAKMRSRLKTLAKHYADNGLARTIELVNAAIILEYMTDKEYDLLTEFCVYLGRRYVARQSDSNLLTCNLDDLINMFLRDYYRYEED